MSNPQPWPEVASLGLGVARAILGEEPKKDPRPWVRGCEKELVIFDQAVSQASGRKRAAESWDDWREANREVRRSKRRRTAWLRDKEVAWWDAKAQKVQDQADQGDAFGFLLLLRNCAFEAPLLLWVTFVQRRLRVNATHGQNIFV